MNIDLINLGFSERFMQEATMYPELFIGRVISASKDIYKTTTAHGEILAEVSGKLRHEAASLLDFPAVGDFVMLDRTDDAGGNAIIHHVLTRKSVFVRKAAGTAHEEQIVAANIDTVFICMAMDSDYNLRRIERYLSIAWDSGAVPVVVLTKSDLSDNVAVQLAEVESVAVGAQVLVTTSLSEDGISAIKPYLQNGKTVAFIGSSGVGKSTLINRIVGEQLIKTCETSSGGKGRHTTTRRELVVLKGGGAVIDTPGMREMGLESADVSRAFADIESLAQSCRFRDCTHQNEPGCAVRAAIQDGTLTNERLASYHKLKKEAKYEGLNSRQIESEKFDVMFAEFGGMKNARKCLKENSKRR